MGLGTFYSSIVICAFDINLRLGKGVLIRGSFE